ncbi:MAG: HTH domain-containing protein [Bacteroidales bacterium]
MSWKKIEKIDQMIRYKVTGRSKEIADKLNVSERSVFYLLKKMKEKGAKIYFDKQLNSYRYKENLKFVFGFKKDS